VDANVEAFLRIPPVPEDIEKSITTPHAHENEHHRPLWLIWKIRKLSRDGVPFFPELDTVCDSEDMARAHVRGVLYESHERVWVERIPANHRFASSLEIHQMNAHMVLWKERVRRLDGD
jgi:hypothetical protein